MRRSPGRLLREAWRDAARAPRPATATRRVGTAAVGQLQDFLPDDKEAARLVAAAKLEARKAERRKLDGFRERYPFDAMAGPLVRTSAKYLQLNIGLYCNQTCNHCHVESSPERTEMMTRETTDQVLRILGNSPDITTLDITGGAPELNTQFRYLVSSARAMRPDIEILDRCNLTCLFEPGQEDLVGFLKEHRVRVVASLPCYSKKNVNQQRGKGVFGKSIEALKLFNAAGYGLPDTGLHLDLMYNPNGAFLAPAAAKLEPDYKRELRELFGIEFTMLHCLNNMPIKRFADFLHQQGKLTEYMELLAGAFNPQNVDGLMCKEYINVRWDGRIYDCDFNQVIDLAPATARTVFDISSAGELTGETVATDVHCLGCTAGAGSK